MIYFDAAYIARLYFEDSGWEKVRALAGQAPVACSIHGYAEVVAVMHRKLREGFLAAAHYRQTMEQFTVDCEEDAYRWLPLAPAVNDRMKKVYLKLPRKVFLRASDALHLACAAENSLLEIYTNDQRVLAAAPYFGLRGIDII
jgi:predicted nucleic acid-binding protein